MSVVPGLFDARALSNNVQNNIIPAPKFFKNTFGMDGVAYPATKIEITKQSGRVKKAPFSVRGKEAVQRGKRLISKDFCDFPHIRRSEYFQVNDAVALSLANPTAYMNPQIQRILADQINKSQQEMMDEIAYRIEWMYWNMLKTTADFTYTGSDNEMELTIDYGRSTDCEISANVDWDETTGDPLYDFELIDGILRAKGSPPADTYIMGEAAWKYFRSNDTVLEVMDNRGMNFGVLNFGSDYIKGYVNGGKPIYVVGDVDDDGSTPLFPTAGVLAFNQKVTKFWHDFGLCTEICQGIDPVAKYVSKVVERDDPSGKLLIVESNPLPQCSNIDWTVYLNSKAS